MPPRTFTRPPTDSDASRQRQPQSFLFVDHSDGGPQARTCNDWKAIRSHVMRHSYRRERDSQLSRLKGDIVRPGENLTPDERLKPLREISCVDGRNTGSFAGSSAPDEDRNGNSIVRISSGLLCRFSAVFLCHREYTTDNTFVVEIHQNTCQWKEETGEKERGAG